MCRPIRSELEGLPSRVKILRKSGVDVLTPWLAPIRFSGLVVMKWPIVLRLDCMTNLLTHFTSLFGILIIFGRSSPNKYLLSLYSSYIVVIRTHCGIFGL